MLADKEETKPAWNPDYAAAYRKRLTMIANCRKNPELWNTLKKFYSRPENCVQWIEDWCFTFDPRNQPPIPKLMPFILFPRQKEMVQFLIECWQDQENGLIEKCRDFGATWVCCAFSVWLWLFHAGTAALFGSKDADLVDKIGDPNSIFQKLRIILNNLPDFMIPIGFAPTKHMPLMKVNNPATGSTISGDAGDNIGRGGRSTIAFKDESAHYQRPENIEAALGDNTNVQIDISSVNGTGNPFYRRRKAGEIWIPGKKMKKGYVRVLILDWRQNPLKSQTWYEERRARAEREGMLHIFAQEVDRDYSSSVVGVIIPPKWVDAAIDAHKALKFPSGGAKKSALDVADSGRDKNAQAGMTGSVLDFMAQWAYADDVGISAMNAVNNCKLRGINELYYDSIGIGAGVKTQTNRMREDGNLPDMMKIYPWNAAEKPLNAKDHIIPGDIQSPLIEEVVQNLKSQGWMSLRNRFEKTYKAVVLGHQYLWEELISIDSSIDHLEELKTELSQPVWAKQQRSGKLLVDKTPDGTSSPNLADVVMMVNHPVKELSIFDVL